VYDVVGAVNSKLWSCHFCWKWQSLVCTWQPCQSSWYVSVSTTARLCAVFV